MFSLSVTQTVRWAVDDKRHLYNKAKITLNQAYKALDNKEGYAYRTYVDGYNEL
jgi:hypothetical protein